MGPDHHAQFMTDSVSFEKLKGFLFINVSTAVLVHLAELEVYVIFTWLVPSDFLHDLLNEFESFSLFKLSTLVTIIYSPYLVYLSLEMDITILFLFIITYWHLDFASGCR